MQEREPRSVKRQSSHRVRTTAVPSVTRDRMACRGELGSDLSTPPGNQPELEQGRAPPVLEDAIPRDRLLAAPALGDPYAQRSILDEPRDQRALVLAHHALDEGDIDTLGRARGELRLEVLLGLHRLGEHDQARGLSIEPMDDEERRARAASRDPVTEEPVGGTLALALGGDGQQTRGLVDDQDVFVLVDEPQGRRTRGGCGRRQLDAVTDVYLGVTSDDDGAVDPNARSGEPLLEAAARGLGIERLQPVDEPRRGQSRTSGAA
jgi:hypothetical protein